MKIQHDDILIDISVGKSRHETSWKNKTMQWSSLVEKLSKTHRTAETYKEYVAAKPARQAEIKDIGGFVGGFITGGRRKSGRVLHRQLITLDLDFCKMDFWESFQMYYDNAALIYSTHKHSDETPRLRLVMPIDRPVSCDEYEAISRKLAGNLGIELFDPTTFQPERLMYWPSTSKDGDFVFEFQDGTWLCADEMLASYVDWTDVSQWPVSSRVSKSIVKGMDKQGEPTEKPGVIGAFCRVYGISEAIETFLSDVYDACDQDDRYTYKMGSTAAGMVVYDDKFAYSHHGTDPTSGRLCNAFDLVRIHLFGLKDEDSREGTPINKLPSFTAMSEFAGKQERVRKLIIQEKSEEARQEFSDFMVSEEGDIVDEDGETMTEDWMGKLDVDKKGNVHGTIDNILLIMENDPVLRGRIAYDDFEKCEVAVKDLPWRKVTWADRRLNDRDDANIRHYLEKGYGISNGNKTKDAMLVWAQKAVFHPVRDYIMGLEWDGVERVDSLLIDYLGAEDSEYTRAVTRKTLCAAVARVFNPGVKFDHILIPVGAQGRGKSSLVSRLGGKWFSESFSFHDISRNGNRAVEQIQGVWIIEIPEMSGMAKAEVETVKHFVSKRDDRFRVAYGRRTENFPRQCIFIGNSNNTSFLRDTTGNRRFWPVAIDVVEPLRYLVELDAYEVGQIWAEAFNLYKEGETLYLSGSVLEEAVKVQRAHTYEHPWGSIIEAYLDVKLPKDWDKMDRYQHTVWLQDSDDIKPEGVQFRTRVCVHEIWYEALGKRDLIDERSANIIHSCMQQIPNWGRVDKVARFGIYGLQRNGYTRLESPYVFNSKKED